MSQFEKTKHVLSVAEWANLFVPRSAFGVLRKESQGLRDAYCENEYEKTKPICEKMSVSAFTG